MKCQAGDLQPVFKERLWRKFLMNFEELSK